MTHDTSPILLLLIRQLLLAEFYLPHSDSVSLPLEIYTWYNSSADKMNYSRLSAPAAKHLFRFTAWSSFPLPSPVLCACRTGTAADGSKRKTALSIVRVFKAHDYGGTASSTQQYSSSIPHREAPANTKHERCLRFWKALGERQDGCNNALVGTPILKAF